ncbi:hypothetical protein [Parahaliea mediterranea]|uniref:UrcA family protein n=1 Tax=Parahaliea mediterranea TaxID=651086 RepID=A0A939ILB3_9GAMM|nr:hypothetical protein [Parahaliea mediterranea]MBN7795798.1 hypothetical protein [Parahaliea mediterranea]
MTNEILAQDKPSRSRAGRRSLMALALCLFAAPGMACDEPSFDIEIPDGKTASESEMAQAQQAVKAYVSAGEAFIACLEDSGSTGSPAYTRKRNDTIDGMEKVAASFNRQLRYFRKNS